MGDYSRYSDEQLNRAIDRLDSEIYRLRPDAPFRPATRQKITRLSAQIDAMIDERDRREGPEKNPAGTLHKKLPPGTQLAPSTDELSIWAGKAMAKVDSGFYDESDTYFDPEAIAQRYVVYLSNIGANPRLLGRRFDQKYGHKSFWDQPFYFRYGSEYGASEGQFEPSFDYWVQISKFSDLGPRQTQAVLKTLRDKGYVEASYHYILPASTWRKLLGMSFEKIQEGDSKEANASYDIVQNRAWEAKMGDVGEEGFWASLPGVYGVTKKGALKFIVSRKASKAGI